MPFPPCVVSPWILPGRQTYRYSPSLGGLGVCASAAGTKAVDTVSAAIANITKLHAARVMRLLIALICLLKNMFFSLSWQTADDRIGVGLDRHEQRNHRFCIFGHD